MYRSGFPPIHESVEHLEARLALERDARLRLRIQLLILIVSGRVKTRLQACALLDVHRNSVTRWLDAYERGGLAEMLRIGPKKEGEEWPFATTLARGEDS